MIESVRQFLSDWALAITSVLGLIIVWNQAKATIMKWAHQINIFNRVHTVEIEVDKIEAELTAHINEGDLKNMPKEVQ